MSVGVFVSALLAAKMLKSLVYPLNYGALFIAAGAALAVATQGFLRVKEVRTNIVKLHKLNDFLTTLKRELLSKSRLRGYLLLVNTLGISLSLLPFILLYSKQYYNINNEQVG